MSAWQPIETDPKDGTWVLLMGEDDQDVMNSYGECWVCIGRFEPRPYNTKWRDQWDDFYGPQQPTHWMPLPEAPNKETEA